jgi:toxin ParE1/3/4
MPSNRAINFTPEAEEDILGILQYTREEWGDLQVDRYLGALESSLQVLLEFPNLGRAHPELSRRLKTYRVREHVVYYAVMESMLVVVRVLHKSHDAREAYIPDISGE